MTNKKEIFMFIDNQKLNPTNEFNYDHMVYVRLFEGCNLACEHCFIPPNPKKIEQSFYQNKGLTNTLVKEASVPLNSKLYIQWHGGEPTLLGPDYLENAILEVQSDDRFKYQHGIQTNLINFSDNPQKWAEVYRKYFNSDVGISWDAKIRHIKRKEQNEDTNKAFEDKFWSNVALAQSYSLNLYLVVTVTKVFFEEFKDPFNFFNMMRENGIHALNFERVTNTGSARASWEKLGLTNKEYSQYMSKFFKAYILFKENNPDYILTISPFDGLLESMLRLYKMDNRLPVQESIQTGNNFSETIAKANVWDILSFKNQGYGCWSGQCDTKFHTIDSNGYKHGCTALTSEQDNSNKELKKAMEGKKIIWLGSSSKEQKDNILQTRKNRQDACLECDYLRICSSGCLAVEKFDESMECSGAKTLFKTIDIMVNKFVNNVN